MRAFASLPVVVSLMLTSSSGHLPLPQASADESTPESTRIPQSTRFFEPPVTQEPRELPHHPAFREYYFSRVAYTGYPRGWARGLARGGGSWAVDYPKADQIFLSFVDRLLSNLDAYEWQHPVLLDDPELRRFPYLYALEVGYMNLTPPEIDGLRGFLLAGGFLVIDDFWGPREWANFEHQMAQVLPGYPIVALSQDHEIFSTFYEITELLQVPNVRNGWASVNGGSTAECFGCLPQVKGIYDENGRLMVVINFNTDLGDAWEWADDPYYPLKFSTYAYEMGVNMIVYAMSH
ncbi:MAG: hypothetical protein BMS9Abin29_0266 [Gemmatimonadota bacterium]|nr:MAG: hypothetical protein BMS9Abin29_0266 [Gemmatimonadota bacterium]